MDDDQRGGARQDGGRDDGEANVLMRVLEGRLREAFARFCADIPQILRSMPQRPRADDGSSRATDDGADFVRGLLEWIAGAPTRSEQASRYLLMWYAKSLAERGNHKLTDGPAVVELLRAHLSRAELADVDLALRANWDALRYGGSLKTLASRQRKAFTASLTADQRRRLGRYLALLPPLAIAAGLPASADAAAGATPTSGPGVASPVSATTSTWLGSVALVIGLPLIAALGWYVIRGRDHEPARATPPPASRPVRSPALDTGVARPTVSATTVATAEPVAAAAATDRTPIAAQPHFRWTRQVSGVTGPLQAVAWSGSRAVVVGRDGVILSSADGVVWQVSLQPVSHNYYAVAHGNGVFVAVGNNGHGGHTGQLIATSRDGVIWDSQGEAERMALNDVAFGDGAFVAVGNGGAIVRSNDGESWRPIDAGTAIELDGVAYLDGQFVAVGKHGTWLTSTDGKVWRRSQHESSSVYGRPVAGNGVTMAFDQLTEAEPHQARAWRSHDLATWAAVEVPACELLVRGAFANGRFVVAGGGLHSTTDGLTWSVEVAPTAPYTGLADVVWTGSMWIAVGSAGVILTGAVR